MPVCALPIYILVVPSPLPSSPLFLFSSCVGTHPVLYYSISVEVREQFLKLSFLLLCYEAGPAFSFLVFTL